MKLWNKYLFKSLASTFLFLILSIFLTFTFVDLSMHGVRFFSKGALSFYEIAEYYVFTFLNQHTYFFPLTFLLASLKVLLHLTRHNELVALQVAGLSRKKILTPFFVFAGILMIASYAHQEWLAPTTQVASTNFRAKHTKHTKKNTPNLYRVALQDHSEIVYQNFQNDELFDVFWIKNNKDIWYMKYLKLNPKKGLFVDHFQKISNGLEKTESFTELDFPQIAFDPNVRLEQFIPLEHHPISSLLKRTLKKNFERQNILCYLHYILATPLLSFVLLFAISPFVFRISQSNNRLLIIALSLFGFIALKTMMDGMMILSENQVVPGYAIWIPMLVVLAFCLPRFAKI